MRHISDFNDKKMFPINYDVHDERIADVKYVSEDPKKDDDDNVAGEMLIPKFPKEKSFVV